MTERERELIEKHTEIFKLLCNIPPNLVQFFDPDSDELLDEKIAVLEALKSGNTISEIPNFYDILELYPKDDTMWD